MRKLVMIKKKNIKIYSIRKRKAHAAALAAACLLAVCFPMKVQAKEEMRNALREEEALGSEQGIESIPQGIESIPQGIESIPQEIESIPQEAELQGVSFPIFHRHTGEEIHGGGCYGEIRYHSHLGNETEGGICYGTPLYHTHQGNTIEGGSCYGTVVYHVHLGSEGSKGGCYAETYHTHTESCYQSGTCRMEYESVGSVTSTTYKECHHHGRSVYCTATAKARHSACGSGISEETIEYCITCGVNSISHDYARNVCGLSSSGVTGYHLACGKTDVTPESYELDCEKGEQDIDSYSLCCEKDGGTIDGYLINCGFDETQPVARLLVMNETRGSKETVTLSARVEDLTDGALDVQNGSFRWYDSADHLISEGNETQVSSNGNYQVTFVPCKEESGLAETSGQIVVNNVFHPTPAPAPSKEKQEDGGDSGKETGNGEGTEQNAQQSVLSPAPTLSPLPLKEAVSTAAPSKEKAPKAETGAWTVRKDADREKLSEKKEESTPSASPSPAATMTDNRQDLSFEGNDKGEEDAGNTGLGQEGKDNDIGRWLRSFAEFFKKPVVKMVTITTGGLLSIGLCTVCLLFLRRTVRLYNDDGTGKMICLGRLAVAREGEDFSVVITQAMIEQSATNRYAIRPGLFLIGRSEEKEMFINKGQKRISVYLSREMIVII